MSNSSPLPERKHVVYTDDELYRGHKLARIAERVPGAEPTDASIDLNDGPTYEARYWRCLGCSQERNRRHEFSEDCDAAMAVALADGGYSVEDPRTTDAIAEDMVVHPDDAAYLVQEKSGRTHRVDPVAEACTCPDNRRHRAYCKHLRRVDLEVRTGTVPQLDA